MGGWLSKGPRFRDVEEHVLQLRRSGMVGFFAPHPRDQLATLPLISKVSEALRGRGIATETHSIEDMRSEVISISVKLHRLRLSRRELGETDSLFFLKDAAIRLELVSGLLERNPGAAVLEVQALEKDYSGPEPFAEAGLFYRLPGTRILHARDYPGLFLSQIKRGLGVLEAGHGRIGTAAAAFGMSPQALRMELPAMLDILLAGRERAAMVCIPADSYEVEPWTENATRFERLFGEGMSRKHTLAPEDVGALAASLL